MWEPETFCLCKLSIHSFVLETAIKTPCFQNLAAVKVLKKNCSLAGDVHAWFQHIHRTFTGNNCKFTQYDLCGCDSDQLSRAQNEGSQPFMQRNIKIMIKGSSMIEGSGKELDIKAQVFIFLGIKSCWAHQ